MNFGHLDVIIYHRLKKSKYAIFCVFPTFLASDFWEGEESLHFGNREFIKEKRQKKTYFDILIKIDITYLIRNFAGIPKMVLIFSQIFFLGVMTS